MPYAAPKADAAFGRSQQPPVHDAAVPAVRNPITWVLLQTAPRIAVLAVSPSRPRLVAEMAHLFEADPVRLIDPEFEVVIASANHFSA